ncbi:MAG: hypothetical protein WAK82_15950 [Streptosporangiaceae bacterium]
MTAHQFIEGLQVTLLTVPDQLLIRDGRRPGNEITSGKPATLHPLRASTAVSGPSRPRFDRKTATVQAPSVRG